MKRTDLQKCCVCKRGVMHDGSPTFFRVTIEPLVVDVRAIERRHGMERMMGGGLAGAVLAQVLGPDDDIAQPLTPARTLFVCRACSMEPMPLMALAEHEPTPT
jgi:hypothetical protein